MEVDFLSGEKKKRYFKSVKENEKSGFFND